MSSGRRPVEPGQVWFVDFDPTRRRQQGNDRAALVVTEQIRTVSVNRFRGYAPELELSADELDDVRRMLARVLTAAPG